VEQRDEMTPVGIKNVNQQHAMVQSILTRHFLCSPGTSNYTGLTRGKRLVTIVGQKKAIAMAVRNIRAGGAVETARATQRPNAAIALRSQLSNGLTAV
jgi:hypothetical protein